MRYFSWLADELTEIEERLAESDLAEISGPLRKAINKAFVKACEADREQRRAAEAATAAKAIRARGPAVVSAGPEPASYIGENPSFGWTPGGGATGGVIQVKAKAAGKPAPAPIPGRIGASTGASEQEPRRQGRADSHAQGPAHPHGATVAPRR